MTAEHMITSAFYLYNNVKDKKKKKWIHLYVHAVLLASQDNKLLIWSKTNEQEREIEFMQSASTSGLSLFLPSSTSFLSLGEIASKSKSLN